MAEQETKPSNIHGEISGSGNIGGFYWIQHLPCDICLDRDFIVCHFIFLYIIS